MNLFSATICFKTNKMSNFVSANVKKNPPCQHAWVVMFN